MIGKARARVPPPTVIPSPDGFCRDEESACAVFKRGRLYAAINAAG
jgi:hypothetical protein